MVNCSQNVSNNDDKDIILLKGGIQNHISQVIFYIYYISGTRDGSKVCVFDLVHSEDDLEVIDLVPLDYLLL